MDTVIFCPPASRGVREKNRKKKNYQINEQKIKGKKCQKERSNAGIQFNQKGKYKEEAMQERKKEK